MSQSPQPQTSPEIIESFARDLAQLRTQAGNPSFRTMAKRSGQIAHTTLHDAVRGNRLPSWDTVEQFVIACNAQPADWKPAWVRASTATDTAPGVGEEIQPEVSSAPAITSPTSQVTPRTQAATAPGDPPGSVASPRFNPTMLWVVAVALTLVLGFVLGRVTAPDSIYPDGARASADRPVTTTTAQSTGGTGMLPKVEGDSAQFVSDVTLADGTVVGTSDTVKKVWRFKNAGQVPWEQRYLERDHSSQDQPCDTPERVEIPTTQPGESVDIEVDITTPKQAGRCRVLWTMTNATGEQMFPGGRPVFFDIVIK